VPDAPPQRSALSLDQIVPPSCCSTTLSASQPAARRTSANSSGRFSSVLNRMRRTRGERHHPFSSEFSCVRDTGVDTFAGYRWIAAHDLVGRDVRRQIVQHNRHQDPRTDQARLPMTDIGLDNDMFAPVHDSILPLVSRGHKVSASPRRGDSYGIQLWRLGHDIALDVIPASGLGSLSVGDRKPRRERRAHSVFAIAFDCCHPARSLSRNCP